MINKQRAKDILIEMETQIKDADLEKSAQLKDILTSQELAWLLTEEEDTQVGKSAPYTIFGILENIAEGKAY